MASEGHRALTSLRGASRVFGDVLRRGRPQQPQIGADDVEPLRRLSRPLEATDSLQHRRRRAGLEFQPGAKRGQPERHLVQVRGLTRAAVSQVRLVHQRGQPRGHLAFDHRLGNDGTHGGRDRVQCGEVAYAGGLERLGRIEDPLSGIGVGERLHRSRDLRQVLSAVKMWRTPDGPEHGQCPIGQRRHIDSAVDQRPQGSVRTRVLNPHVQHGGAAHPSRRVIQLLRPDAEVQNLSTADRGGHEVRVRRRTDTLVTSAGRSPTGAHQVAGLRLRV